ncbi:FoF1 ATP synthase subunit gamma [Gudongella sp. DL1XJH-153]|uniref:F0F1 ATP synthase subunit gamma n=1 Tax=Gudongella sp. DL1XJH-153 TaxID=3409804 RepID=UPI003BB62ECD
MQTLQNLRRSIDSAESLKSIVKTMKAHASMNINQFQNAAEASGNYRQILDMAIYIVLSQEEEGPVENIKSKEGSTLHIVFGSDHGLAGRFNENITDYTKSKVESNSRNIVIAVGQQIYKRLEAEYDIYGLLPVPQTNDGITSVVQKLLVEIEDLRNKENISSIILHYCKPEAHASYTEQSSVLFPVDFRKFGSEEMEWESRSLPTYEMDRELLISDIIRQYFFVTLFRSFCYSLVSENISRIESMTSAEKNIDEKLEQLNFSYSTQRQNGITEELNDVVSGYKAIRRSQ